MKNYNRLKPKNKVTSVLYLIFLLLTFSSQAQITWPSNQILPSFSPSAQHQDLIILNGSTVQDGKIWRWEAEGTSISHKTGRLETDGWLCQTGIDAPNDHMAYGPYDKSIPAGPNTAEFRMKVDNNTANNDAIVDIDVRNYTTGKVLAFQTITRQQFSGAGNYTNFKLPFIMPADNQAIELRVFWHGKAYTKIDWVSVQQNNSDDEMYLFASLKGLVNRIKPRIFSYEGDALAEGPYTWLQSLGLSWTEHSDRWELITKYLNEISGLIVYDPAQIHTVNLATMLAKNKKALIVSPSLLSRLTSAPYNLPILLDLRGQFSSKIQVYQTLYDTYWSNIDHRLLIGLNPEAHKASLREYASALGTAVIWLDPKVSEESKLLNSFLSSMPAGANYMGWWPEESVGITRASSYGIATIPSDYCTNLTVHSGMPRKVNVKPIPAKPILKNKIYVAFILSDGDNLQYVEHLMRKLWNNPDRGSVPIGWTLSPAMLDAMPGALNFYHETATENDNLISGPSGLGYTYPNSFPNQSSLNEYLAKTEEYNNRAGFRVVTVWNTITGGINQNVGESYATHTPSLLGITGQNTGGSLSIYNQSLPGKPLSCNYCTGEQVMKDHIASAAAGWNGAEPRFIIIQAQPWSDVKPSNFKNVASSLNGNYEVVRPDHLFQLLREAKGLPINPGGNNSGVATVYEDCSYGGYAVGLGEGRYTKDQLLGLGAKDNAISSLKVKPGYQITLYFDDNFTGTSLVKRGDTSCLVDDGFNDQVTSIKVSKSSGGESNIFVEAENYSNMSGVQTENCSEGGENVGYIDTGDWMVYTNVNFPSSGNYRIEYRVASTVDKGVLSADFNAGTTVLGKVNIPNTGGWQNWTTVSHTVSTNAGTYSLGLFAQSGGWNINWIKITWLGNVKISNEKQINTQLIAYPSPTSKILNLRGFSKETSFKVYNINGKQVMKGNLKDGQTPSRIDVEQLNSGIYLVKDLNTGNIVRFIKK
ncbi:putative secreted protein (Por secretion system target) [Aquimarina sp. MAR_2010_214]|uniref:carbohydrate-binding protein n=1 Tax=Aquimarina sp. MAR_2010_214 TaxID=1250026 RepID=UPI000C709678|nr:carbohydrate-binding protein [Aquimarina sp. MAR_2010_214]PKV50178.1 putative secreted protein (Por secretion system target) [Aquimarina sp. MAR_2010_214]